MKHQTCCNSAQIQRSSPCTFRVSPPNTTCPNPRSRCRCPTQILTHHSAHSNTQNSPLLRLPAEIRNTIYDLVLSSHRDFHTFDVARQKRMRQNGGSETTIQQLALLQVCRQLYTETNLIALNSTPFAFGSVTDFSKYIAQTLLPTQIAAITVLKVSSDCTNCM